MPSPPLPFQKILLGVDGRVHFPSLHLLGFLSYLFFLLCVALLLCHCLDETGRPEGATSWRSGARILVFGPGSQIFRSAGGSLVVPTPALVALYPVRVLLVDGSSWARATGSKGRCQQHSHFHSLGQRGWAMRAECITEGLRL